MSSTTPAVRDLEGNQKTTLVYKEEMVKRVAFSHPPKYPVATPPSQTGMTHCIVDNEAVRKTLYI